jgi:hypothetical protein
MFALYMDQDSMDKPVVAGLRANGWDILTTAEAGRLRGKDDVQLAFATSVGRVLYTANVGDFRRLHQAGIEHGGIIARPDQRMRSDAQIRALLALASQMPAHEMPSTFVFLSYA